MEHGSVERWAKREFRHLELVDRRLRSRTVALAIAAAQTPSGHITQVVETEAEQEAAFRWVRNPAIDEGALLQSSAYATAVRCAEHPFVFVPVDQTTVKLVDRGKTKGFGHVGRGSLSRRCRGLQAMTALAVSPTGTTLGLLGQSWWARADEPAPAYQQDTRPVEERESGMWTDCIKQAQQNLHRAEVKTRLWFQLDRGADAHHVLRCALEQQHWVTIRSSYNRRLAGPQKKHLRDCFSNRKRAGFMPVDLGKRRAIRLGRSPHRPLKLAISYTKTTLLITDAVTKKKFEMPIFVVRAREHRPPTNKERIEWSLLTTYPVESLQDARQVVNGYTYRWRVEEFHRTWKTGACNIESSQLRSRANFQRWATLLAAVATRIERLKFLARNKPKTPAIQEFSRDEIDAAILRTKTNKHKRGDDLNIAQVVHLIALIGGYTGNKKQGPPGTVTIRRGLEKVEMLALGMQLGRTL